MILYHGTNRRFNEFDNSFYGTGEGKVTNYKGWFFCSGPQGALHHCLTWLKCKPYGEGGIVLVCEVEDKYVEDDIEREITDPKYGRPIFGVSLDNTQHIKVIERVEALSIFVERYGDPIMEERKIELEKERMRKNFI